MFLVRNYNKLVRIHDILARISIKPHKNLTNSSLNRLIYEDFQILVRNDRPSKSCAN